MSLPSYNNTSNTTSIPKPMNQRINNIDSSDDESFATFFNTTTSRRKLTRQQPSDSESSDESETNKLTTTTTTEETSTPKPKPKTNLEHTTRKGSKPANTRRARFSNITKTNTTATAHRTKQQND